MRILTWKNWHILPLQNDSLWTKHLLHFHQQSEQYQSIPWRNHKRSFLLLCHFVSRSLALPLTQIQFKLFNEHILNTYTHTHSRKVVSNQPFHRVRALRLPQSNTITDLWLIQKILMHIYTILIWLLIISFMTVETLKRLPCQQTTHPE